MPAMMPRRSTRKSSHLQPTETQSTPHGTVRTTVVLIAATLALGGCSEQASTPPSAEQPQVESWAGMPPVSAARLEQVATSPRQWTGVTVVSDTPAHDGRIFVNFPRWSDDVPISVAEVRPAADGGDAELVAFPDTAWNDWTPEKDPAAHFVCVQSVIAAGGSLWALDPANPGFQGVVDGGAKLVQIGLDDGAIERIYPIGGDAIRSSSYLNDVRFDLGRQIAYITDSGDGAVLVLDLETGTVRRLLDEHPSTEADGIELTIGGAPWLRDGATPQIHADGIALTADRDQLYFQPLTGRELFRVPTERLRAALDAGTLDADGLAASVETVGKTGAADGILFGPHGALYLTSLEHDAIRRLLPAGEVEYVVRDERIAWPDTLSADADGAIYFTTAQIHRGANPPEPYGLWRIAWSPP
ncbi:MAG: L-dopachrome tautomerase-related protein [Acidobacteriota bacterium]